MAAMKVLTFVDQFVDRFLALKTSTWAASVAFYTALSLAPLLMLFLTISARLSSGLHEIFLEHVRSTLGPVASSAVEAIIRSAKDRTDLVSLSGIVGTFTVVVSASLIFGEMRAALDEIFGLVPEPVKDEKIYITVIKFLRERLTQIGLVFGFIFAMIASLVITTLINFAIQQDSSSMVAALNIVLSFIFYVIVFTALFRYLPGKRLAWHQASRGGALTAMLFEIGKELIGIYLGNSALNSSYGAAGSVVVLLAWVYYSSMIIFIGAHVSYLLHDSPPTAAARKVKGST